MWNASVGVWTDNPFFGRITDTTDLDLDSRLAFSIFMLLNILPTYQDESCYYSNEFYITECILDLDLHGIYFTEMY